MVTRRGARLMDRLETAARPSAGTTKATSVNRGAVDCTLMRVKAMSPSFVRYTPDIEAVDPGFGENLRIVIARTEKYIAQSVRPKAPAVPSATPMPKATGWSGAR